MNRLSTAFTVRCSVPRWRIRLELERLEDRRVLAVTYHAGPLLQNVQVEPIFYGAYWNSDVGQQQSADLDSFLGYLTNSSYMDMLNEYGVGRGQLVANGIVAGADSSASKVNDTALQQTIEDSIGTGILQPANPNRLYIVFTAPNVDVVQGSQDSVNNFFGYHNYFSTPAGEQIYYAVIAHPIGNGTFYSLDNFQTLTKTTSHELAEAVTDPGVGGWYDGRTGNEIGDIADGPRDVGLLNGFVVQAEWSAHQRAPILPAEAQWIDASSFTAAKSTSAILAGVANAFTHSAEYFTSVVTQDYQQLLHRTPSAAEVSSWVNLLESGLSDEQVLAAFTSSPEYYQQAGGTDQAWLDALYHDLLGRDADGVGESAWLQMLASGTTRFNIAYGIAASVEHESIVVSADYQNYLGRSADASEVAGWVNALEHGMSDEQVVAAFVGSDEFYAAHGSSSQSWLTGAYQFIFQRDPDTGGFNYWDARLQDQLTGG
ncbi:MAG TPA: DUF4214 domain-containing protein [Gemmataceae bacterium]|nr:DUF4214 domain-containing protein [Gemmataceae bacterium]